MITATVQPKENQPLVALFGMLSALLVAGVLANVTPQLGVSDRMAFLALVLLGLAMCATGKLGMGAVYGWAHPLHMAGYVLGTIGLVLAVFVWFNWPIPFIATERAALIAMAVLMLAKVGVAQLYHK